LIDRSLICPPLCSPFPLFPTLNGLLEVSFSLSFRSLSTIHLLHFTIFHFHFSLPPKMHSSLSLSFSATSSSAATVSRSRHSFHSPAVATPLNLRFCGLRREAFASGLAASRNRHHSHLPRRPRSAAVSAALSSNGIPPKSFDYDLLIIGAGVGGHGAALHAVEKVRSQKTKLHAYLLMRDAYFDKLIIIVVTKLLNRINLKCAYGNWYGNWSSYIRCIEKLIAVNEYWMLTAG